MKKKIFSATIIIGLISVLATGCTEKTPQATTPVPTVEATITSATPQPSSVNTQMPTNNTSDETNEEANVENLASDGYDEESIQACESYVSRVILQLNEIETFSRISLQPAGTDTTSEDAASFSELLAKIDEQAAIYYITKLSNNFDSLEDATNEYLFTLQADIDIQLYFSDKASYDKQKTDLLSNTSSDYITVRAIDEQALAYLQNINNANPVVPGADTNPGPNVINPQPEIPTVEIPKPVNPSEQIQNMLPF